MKNHLNMQSIIHEQLNKGNTVIDLVSHVFNETVRTFRGFFESDFFLANPSKDKISFPERNLTFNFCSNYIQINGLHNSDKIYVWQELRINMSRPKIALQQKE